MKSPFKTACLYLLLGLPANAQSDSIMGEDSLKTVGELLRGTWLAEAPDHMGNVEGIIIHDKALGIGTVDSYGDTNMYYEGGYTLDRTCNGTRADSIYIVTELEHDPCWEILVLDLSRLTFRDMARFVPTEFVIQSRPQ